MTGSFNPHYVTLKADKDTVNIEYYDPQDPHHPWQLGTITQKGFEKALGVPDNIGIALNRRDEIKTVKE